MSPEVPQLERLLSSFEDAELGCGATDEQVAAAEEDLGPRFEGTYRLFLLRGCLAPDHPRRKAGQR